MTGPVRLLQLAYDGRDFAGCPLLPGRRTIGSELGNALRRMGVVESPDFVSRTDAGVHARGQVAILRDPVRVAPGRMLELLDARLPSDLRCLGIAERPEVPSVVSKTYVYRLDLSVRGDPWAHRAWRPAVRVDTGALVGTAPLLEGERDWSAFARRGEQRSDLVRRIDRVRWSFEHGTACTIEGPGFTYRLVRSLVGAMVAVASGTCTLEQLHAALDGQASPAARQQAPARGLCLERIRFEEEVSWLR